MCSIVAGAMAGLAVDLLLYPIDTIKTRIQSKDGFRATGGFKNIYRGMGAVAIGSVPGGAAFFFGYETIKELAFRRCGVLSVNGNASEMNSTVFACQALAAVVGEASACCVRAPVELVKQRMQAGQHATIRATVSAIFYTKRLEEARTSGCIRNLFSGMGILLLREFPFSIIQMSLYESLKHYVRHHDSLQNYTTALFPICGGLSGCAAAFTTTPLDVLKTRIMLRDSGRRSTRISDVVQDILKEPLRPGDRFGVVQRFFRGASMRVLWISIGGSIYFTTYEFGMRILND